MPDATASLRRRQTRRGGGRPKLKPAGASRADGQPRKITMSTRYSLPDDCEGNATARAARALAAIALMVCVLALSLLAAFAPATESPKLSSTADEQGANAPSTFCSA
jgi:hypothetical protein